MPRIRIASRAIVVLVALIATGTGDVGIASTDSIDGAATADQVAMRMEPPTTGATTTTTAAQMGSSPTSPGLLVVSGDDGILVNFDQMVTAPGVCSIRYEGIDPLPDPRCTPGAISARVTQANLVTTICASGYTASVRPSSSATNKVKAVNYITYAQTSDPRDENDHLVPLELGGANDPRNLWNEPPTPGQKATTNVKDTVEGKLHDRVCAGTLALADAQRRIVADWTTALTSA